MNIDMVLREVFQFMADILSKLNQFQVAPNVSITEALFGFLILSIVISVFWKGGRG